MEALKVALIVIFVIISFLTILLVLIQNDEGGGLGGLLSGSGSAAFGSHSASVINKTTFVFVGLFFVVAFSIALLTKAPAKERVEAADQAIEEQLNSNNGDFDWVDSLEENPVEVPADTLSADNVQ
ncbi:MAG: preprotein translocase subunit SecG [Treponema sp.]|nr:preprotein translocase subunit SecG [Candidatus Treponema merdequi]